ncbi:Mobile element protein [uncultured Candidatus Thioglobus sp.]|nr:Mobile element protein [uncultured Candidatus Thioglobus sp.]
MPTARKQLINLEITPYYHCISRCVRRAFLCGIDAFSDKSYEHRRGWVESRLFELANIFAIDVAAYAVMSNHTHLVLHIDKNSAVNWSFKEVVYRWSQLHSGDALAQQYLKEETLPDAEMILLKQRVDLWRLRLHDISWFMRSLNEFIARRANKEDECTGRFWEGRFKSQALLDDAALLTCMAYVDLNPIRAKIAQTLETSDYSSVAQRIKQLNPVDLSSDGVKPLLPFINSEHKNAAKGIPFSFNDYLSLVETTGRAIVLGKRGHIPEDQSPILQRLNIQAEHWLYLSTHFESQFKGLVGCAHTMLAACSDLKKNWCHGLSASRHYFPN